MPAKKTTTKSRAAMADQESNKTFTDELMKLDGQHTQTIISSKISTNYKMQYRSTSYGL